MRCGKLAAQVYHAVPGYEVNMIDMKMLEVVTSMTTGLILTHVSRMQSVHSQLSVKDWEKLLIGTMINWLS